MNLTRLRSFEMGNVTATAHSYVERELSPLGFLTVSSTGKEVVLSHPAFEEPFTFRCVCPSPQITKMGCALHHRGPGGSWPVHHAAQAARDSAR